MADPGKHNPGGDPAQLNMLHFYKEDVVCVTSETEKHTIGIIVKTSGGDSESESEEEDDEEEEDLEDGHARVNWLQTPTRTTEKMQELRVVDRAFLHGDIVAKASDLLGQTGTVVNLEIMVDLEASTGEILTGIDSKRLRRVRSFVHEQCVIHGRWLGRVQEVADDVTVLFDDGAKCQVKRAEPERLYSLHENPLHDDDRTPFYPGQRLRAGTSALYKDAKWLRGQWKPHRLEGTVVDVETGIVMVHWLAAGYPSKAGESQSQPPMCMSPKHLHPVNYWEFASWRLGDLTLTPSGVCNEDEGSAGSVDLQSNQEGGETSTSGDASEAFSSPGFRRAKRKAMKKEKKRMAKMGLEEEYEKTLLVVGIQTKLDVLWQDGTIAKGIQGLDLVPVDYLGGNDFFPHEYVMEKPPDGDTYSHFAEQKTGWVKSVDAKQRTAVVCWLNDSVQDKLEEEVVESVYELVEHTDYSYRLGDVVIRFSTTLSRSAGASASGDVFCPLDFKREAAEPPAMEESDEEPGAEEAEGTDDSSSMQADKNDRDDNADADSREGGSQLVSWVGEIIELRDGFIGVCWADGTKSRVRPQEVFVVNRMDDQSEGDGEDGDDSQYIDEHSDDDGRQQRTGGDGEKDHDADSQASWETETAGYGDEEHDPDEEALETQPGDGVPVAGPELVSDAPATDGEDGRQVSLIEGAGTMLMRLAGLFGGSQPPPESGRAAGAEHWPGHARKWSLGLADILHDHDAKGSGCAAVLSVNDNGDSIQHNGVCSQLSCACSEADAGRTGAVQATDSRSLLHTGQASGSPEPTPGMPSLNADADVAMAEAGPASEGDVAEREGSAMDEGEEREGEERGGREDGSGQERGLPEVTAGSSREAEEGITVFKRFDCLQSPEDHFYKGETGQASGKKWMKKVQQEWAMLEKSLPDTIAVRVYEDRMDLLRAVIIGAAGTPYDDGLFFFDFYFPPDYPNSPPLAHYHSGGLRLNPNLYSNGKVCLSLLNTWNGKGNEVWTPSTSTLLQVLVSLQGLVLVSKPYFNEAGYERQVGSAEGEKNAIVYNENTFLLCCKSILYLLRRPPQNFEEFVKTHFREQAAKVLWACDAYLAGARVGSLPDKIPEGGAFPTTDDGDGTSTGFKLMLAKLRARLAEAFAAL